MDEKLLNEAINICLQNAIDAENGTKERHNAVTDAATLCNVKIAMEKDRMEYEDRHEKRISEVSLSSEKDISDSKKFEAELEEKQKSRKQNNIIKCVHIGLMVGVAVGTTVLELVAGKFFTTGWKESASQVFKSK